MTRKGSVRPPEVLTSKEVMALLRRVQNSIARSAMKLMYLCGLSEEETVSVMVRDIDSDNKILKIAMNKTATGEKARWVQLSKPASAMVDGWLKERPTSRWLFPEGETHISVESLKVAFDQALVKSSIRKKVSVGNLRKSCALVHLTEERHDVLPYHFCHCDARIMECYVRTGKE